MSYFFLFWANFVFIGLKAAQQRNVAFDKYIAVMPISWMLGLTEVYVIAQIAVNGFSLWLALLLGTAGGAGALFAMWLHNKVFGENGKA